MKAIILAGGEGTRLRPVTGDLPKPLVPLLGRPLMEHILLLLRAQGFTEVCAAVRYRAEEIERRFGDGSELGLRLSYRREQEERGTAGAVRGCLDFIGEEDVLVISGDAACDLPLRELYEQHRVRGAAATLALYRDPAPLRFGLAVTDESDRIRAFVEKPEWSRVVTDLVNTGIYVLSPRAVREIPEGRRCDFAKELFPALLKKGETLLGLPLKGYWCDVGTPLSYYRCCIDALEGRLRLTPSAAFAPAKREESAEEGDALRCPVQSRARVMGTLSELFLELGADYSDGLRLTLPRGSVHIRPSAADETLRVSVRSGDAEFAQALSLRAKELIEAIDSAP